MSRTGIGVDSMRRIDRIAGVPLCFLASGFLKIWRRLRPRPPRPIRRILFIELSEMCSTVLADPAMRKARERTGAENYFVIFTQNAGSLSIMGTIDPCNVFTIGTSSRNPVRGPALQNADLMLGKIFRITERVNLEFRAEVFNVTNTPPLNDPNGSFGSAAFGTITSAGNPRDFEFAAKVHF